MWITPTGVSHHDTDGWEIDSSLCSHLAIQRKHSFFNCKSCTIQTDVGFDVKFGCVSSKQNKIESMPESSVASVNYYFQMVLMWAVFKILYSAVNFIQS